MTVRWILLKKYWRGSRIGNVAAAMREDMRRVMAAILAKENVKKR